MRIISGRYKSRVIKIPRGIRPTQGKVRKAIFDILGDIEGLSFLELFAGSGAVGIEALSHGAKEVVFVENDRRCLKKLKDNLSSIAADSCSLLPLGGLKAIKKLARNRHKFDLIFLDPPYQGGLSKKTLKTLASYDILTSTGLVIVQHFNRDSLPEETGDLILFKQACYGDTILSFYKKAVA